MLKQIKDYRIDLINHQSAKGEDRTKHIHVTDLSRCLAGVWQEKKGLAKQDINDSKLRRFDAGHNIESRVVDACEHAKILHSTQGHMNWPEVNMVGSYDLLLEDPAEGQKWLLEVKSIHPYGITHLYKTNKVHEHYREQVNLYLNNLREEYPDIKGMLYYEALDGRTAEYEIEYDVAIVDSAMARARLLYRALIDDKMPEPPETFIQENGKWKLNWRIEYCLTAGVHQQCDPEMAKLSPDPIKIVNKLKYQAKKMND